MRKETDLSLPAQPDPSRARRLPAAAWRNLARATLLAEPHIPARCSAFLPAAYLRSIEVERVLTLLPPAARRPCLPLFRPPAPPCLPRAVESAGLRLRPAFRWLMARMWWAGCQHGPKSRAAHCILCFLYSFLFSLICIFAYLSSQGSN